MIIEDANIVKSPVVSVIVATYKQEQFIAQCLDAILSQQFDQDWELIIGDDKSPDKTTEICKQYQRKYPEKIRLDIHETNVGCTGNYNALYALARGKYIVRCDGDDYWCDNQKLQKQYDYMESHPECGLVSTNVNYVDASGRVYATRVIRQDDYPKSFEDQVVRATFFCSSSWMFRRELVQYYDASYPFADESYAFSVEAFRHSEVHLLDECMTNYRTLSGTISSAGNAEKFFKQYNGVFESQKYFIKRYHLNDDLQTQIYSKNYFELLPYALEIHNEEFVQQAKAFFEAHHMCFDFLLLTCNYSNMYKQQRNNAWASKSYRLGKALLSPFKRFKK